MDKKGEAFASSGTRTKDLQRLGKGTNQTGYGTDLVKVGEKSSLKQISDEEGLTLIGRHFSQ
jgi:hypothetical protein